MILDFLLFGCGVYVLVQNIRMKATGKVPAGLINPKVNMESAPDIEGYIKYTYIRGLIFGIILIVFSGIMTLQSFVEVPALLLFISEIMYIGTLIYYAVISVKAQNRFLFKHNKEILEKRKSEKIKNAASYVNTAAQEEEQND